MNTARNRASEAGFILSLVGATYQMFAYPLAYLVNNQQQLYSVVGLTQFIFPGLAVFWAASHLLDNETNRNPAWAAIIVALGIYGLGFLIIGWITPVPSPFYSSQQTEISTNVALTVIAGPLLTIIGGILALIGVRHQPKRQPI